MTILSEPADKFDAAPMAASIASVDTPAIHARELTKTYGRTVALAGLSMTVARGEIFGFLGPNGAGKTTAVKLLVGLSVPTSGEAWVLGAPLGDIEVRRRIGYLPELFRYQDWLSGREVLDLHCRLARILKADRPREIERAIYLAGLTGRGDDRVGTYSKGMQQRLGLGAALVGSPEVIFLDEPTSALDPVGRHDVRRIIRDVKSRGVTVFLNSHLLSEVEQVCDRVAIVDKGKVIAKGTLDELKGMGRSVRIRAAGLTMQAIEAVRELGQVQQDDGSILVSGVEDETIPEIVARLVSGGARIYAVEPAGGSLEESFLNLLEAQDHGPAHDSGPHAT
jgi:ABC-2 type transport system ATP-binding protein